MKNLTRAQRKKAVKQFKVGDVVTWGNGCCSHRVVEVTERGVVVDVTSYKDHDRFIDVWAAKQPDGRYFVLVLFDRNMQGPGPRCRFREHGVDRGPPRHSTDEPDKLKPLSQFL